VSFPTPTQALQLVTPVVLQLPGHYKNIQLTVLFEICYYNKVMFNAGRKKKKPNSFASLLVAITETHTHTHTHTLYFLYIVQTIVTAE